MSNILIEQIKLLTEEPDSLASLANITACINEYLKNINWVGFYFVKNNELVLGPFQGKVACTHIKFTNGVCGTCYMKKHSLIVDDVHKFKGHIACDSASNSELVIPIFDKDEVIGLIDIDSPLYSRFTEEEKITFEKISFIIAPKVKALLKEK